MISPRISAGDVTARSHSSVIGWISKPLKPSPRAAAECCLKGSNDELDGVIELTPLGADARSLRINDW